MLLGPGTMNQCSEVLQCSPVRSHDLWSHKSWCVLSSLQVRNWMGLIKFIHISMWMYFQMHDIMMLAVWHNGIVHILPERSHIWELKSSTQSSLFKGFFKSIWNNKTKIKAKHHTVNVVMVFPFQYLNHPLNIATTWNIYAHALTIFNNCITETSVWG